jgi:8-oxo-dGTP diphosphatase
VKDRLSLLNNSPPLISPVWVAAVALVNKAGFVLVQRRNISGTHPGLWEFPGGKLEPGESPEEAAVRELHEELGIIIAMNDLRPVSFASATIERASGSLPVVILLFACERWEGFPSPLAATTLAWSDPVSLATWPMPPLDYPLAQALAKMMPTDAN